MPHVDQGDYRRRVSLLPRTDNSFDNLFITKHSQKDQSRMRRKVVIAGHRGGFQVDNSLDSFRKSKEMHLEVVELDVWITTDDKIVVVHGSFDGALPKKISDSQYAIPPNIYDLTYAEAQEHFAQTQQFEDALKYLDSENPDVRDIQLPLLDDVVELIDRSLTINIEVKTPRDVTLRPNYDSDRLIRVLHEKLQNTYNIGHEKKIGEYVFITSFDHDFLHRYIKYQEDRVPVEDQIRIMYLHTRKITDLLPGPEVTKDWLCGCNIQTAATTPEVVRRFHDEEQLVGVWIDKDSTHDEGTRFWQSVFNMDIDMLCTDHPLEAIQIRDQFYEQSQAKL